MIGNKLKEFRSKNKITQKELSSIINISVNDISLIENNKKEMDANTLLLLTKHFNITVGEFLGNDSVSSFEVNKTSLEVDLSNIKAEKKKIFVLALIFIFISLIISILISFYFDSYFLSLFISFYLLVLIVSFVIELYLNSIYKKTIKHYYYKLLINPNIIKRDDKKDFSFLRAVQIIYHFILRVGLFLFFILIVIGATIITPITLIDTLRE